MSSDLKAPSQFTSIGGQAVIEGVMMKSPKFIAVAVRKPNKQIVIRAFRWAGLSQRYPILKKPILRGITTLFESMIQGIDALSYSAEVAADSEMTGKEMSSWAIAGSIAVAFFLGIGLFVALPHFLTVLFASETVAISTRNPVFHLVDGFLKILILLGYVFGIGLMKDIHRVFQYHGAEHKSIYTFEAGEDLNIENARKHPTLHPRCGTSFLLFLVLISIFVFSVVFPLLQLTELTSKTWLNHVLMVGIKILLMFPVAGVAYEFIKACSMRMRNPIFRAMIWPGMVLQKLTTREPSDDQIEVALASLKQVLLSEKALEAGTASLPSDGSKTELQIGALSELALVSAKVTEFPEA